MSDFLVGALINTTDIFSITFKWDFVIICTMPFILEVKSENISEFLYETPSNIKVCVLLVAYIIIAYYLKGICLGL